MVGRKIGGVNVFGGGLALYNEEGEIIGGIGVSGDLSCADHIIAWKARNYLGLDYVPGGVSETGDDNIIFDIEPDPQTGNLTSAGGYGHPECTDDTTRIAEELPETHPIGEARRSGGTRRR